MSTTTDVSVVYKRAVLKISGEALSGSTGFGIDFAMLDYVADEVSKIITLGVEIAIVVGGGNFFRGANLCDVNAVDRITSDQIGMISTLINSLALCDVFKKHGMKSEILSAVTIEGVAKKYDVLTARRILDEKTVLILSCGIGNPLVTTDFTLSMRGVELDADILLKATNVDYVCSHDPNDTNNKCDIKTYKKITYDKAIKDNLHVMDMAAFCLCREHKKKLRVFNIKNHGALLRVMYEQEEGTLITN